MPEVKFIEREDVTKNGFNVSIVMNNKPTKGQIGIEIEIEGKNLPHEDETPAPWKYVIDHSLRGEDNGEYILAKPLDFSAVPKALDKLWSVFSAKKSKFDESNRTSVHIHLNCQDFHFNRLTSYLAMYFALEEVLTEWCGEHRIGNLFCLRAVDAPAIITHLKKFIKSDAAYPLHDILHYAAMNPNALQKYGSLEIRTLQGCSDPKVIQNWINIHERIYNFSKDFPDPREVPAMFSSGGPLSFFDILLGDQAQIVRDGITWNNGQVSEAMFRGIRFAQDLVYCRDWDAFKKVDIKPDPFGRNSRKMAEKIMAAASGDSAAPTSGSILGLEAVMPEWAQEAPNTLDDYDY